MKIETLLILSFAISGISFTITTTSMFKWLREFISPIHHKVEELIHCPWCFSHWVTFITILIIGSNYKFTGIAWIDFFLTAFSIIGISGVIHYVLLRAYEPVAKAMLARELKKFE